MEAVMHYNQYSQGGAVEREVWELSHASELSRTYGSIGTIATATVELPDGWAIGKDICDRPRIYADNGTFEVHIKGDEHTIYATDGSTPFFKKIWSDK